jgi:hypothetical protein
MSQTAREFLTRCFAPDETIALLMRRENPPMVMQRVVRLSQALEPRYRAWLNHENRAGANIYVAANPLLAGTRKRTKESIATVRHLYIDIDTEGDARLAAIRASDSMPAPTAILSTSPGKYQVLWRVEGFDFEHQEQALKLLALAFGGDPACTDRSRVLRLPGLLNHKYHPAHRVAVEYSDDSVWTPGDFRVAVTPVDLTLLGDQSAIRKHSVRQTPSEDDWAWVSEQLALGKDPRKLTREVALRCPDKASPLYYAQHTVDVSSARLWLLEGIPLGNVITMLAGRRSFEIPAAPWSARTREIAATAERMIVRRKTA